MMSESLTSLERLHIIGGRSTMTRVMLGKSILKIRNFTNSLGLKARNLIFPHLIFHMRVGNLKMQKSCGLKLVLPQSLMEIL
jgi:hypothetical protein